MMENIFTQVVAGLILATILVVLSWYGRRWLVRGIAFVMNCVAFVKSHGVGISIALLAVAQALSFGYTWYEVDSLYRLLIDFLFPGVEY